MMEPCERKASRQDYLSTLSSFIKSSNEVIKRFTKEIGWTKPPDRANMSCGFTEVHRSAEKISEANSINEYSEEPLLPSFPLSASHNFSVKIDAEMQRNLLLPYRKNAPDLRQPPASAGELTVNFMKEERLILYEHTLKNATPVATPPELHPGETTDSFDSHPKELSGLELKKAMRDFKRRRQTYRTKVSTKNKTQTEVTREIIHNMMALLGVEEPEFDLLGTPNSSNVPLCNSDGDSDLDTLDKRAGFTTPVHKIATDSREMRDLNYTKHLEQRSKRSEQESHSRSRSPREHMKAQKYDNTCRLLIKDEKKHRRMEKKYDIKSEGQGTFDKYQSRCKDRRLSQNREKRRGKNNDESEYRDYEHREMRRDKKEKYENEGRHHRQESFSSKSRKRERSESRKRKGNDKR